MPEQPSSRRIPLTRKAILDAAVARADSDGIEAVSMRTVAQALGVVPMALYNHISSKQALLSGMVDVIVTEIPPLDPDQPWQPAIRQRVLAAREVMMRHPWAVEVIKSRTEATPAVLQYINELIGAFLSGGFSPELAHQVMHALGSRMWGFALDVFPTPATPDDPSQRAALFEVMRAAYPNIATIAVAGAHPKVAMLGLGCDNQTEFEFGLDILLDGFEAHLRAAAAHSRLLPAKAEPNNPGAHTVDPAALGH